MTDERAAETWIEWIDHYVRGKDGWKENGMGHVICTKAEPEVMYAVRRVDGELVDDEFSYITTEPDGMPDFLEAYGIEEGLEGEYEMVKPYVVPVR